MSDLASLRIAEDRVEWAVRESRESGDVYWDRRASLEDAETDLASWRRTYPRRTFDVVSHRVITTCWASA